MRKLWAIGAEVVLTLTGRHSATMITLQRLTPRGGEHQKLTFILVKTIKGKACGPDHRSFGQRDRKALAHVLFELLLASEPMTFVVGDIGFSLGSIFRYSHEYRLEKGRDIGKELKVLTRPDQNLCCIHLKAVELTFNTFVCVNNDLPARVFLLRMEARSEQSEIELDQQPEGSMNSSGSHPAISHQEFVKMLSEATDEQEIASIMLHPVVTRKQKNLEGPNLEGPVDITATTILLRDSL